MAWLPKSPLLRRILLAYTVNELGTWLGYVALMIGVYDHTHSALATAGLLVSGRLLPAMLVPMLVALVERSSRRGALSLLYLLEAASAGGLAILLWHFSLPAILLLVAVDGTAALSANALLRVAAARAATAEDGQLSERDRALQEDEDPEEIARRKANAALNVAFTISVPAGAALGGLVVALAGGPTALLIDAASFLGCAALLMGVSSHVAASEEDDSARGRLRAALSHLRAVPQLRLLLLTEAAALVVFFAVEPVEAPYVKGSLHSGDLGFGLLMAAWGIGMVMGGIFFARSVRRPLGGMLTGGTLLVGLAYLGWALAPDVTVACAAALVGGIGNGVQWPSLISAVQQLTPVALQGRMLGAVNSVNALCPAVGFALGGAVATLSSPRAAMTAAGVATCAVTIIFVRLAMRGPLAGGIAAPAGTGIAESVALKAPLAVSGPGSVGSSNE